MTIYCLFFYPIDWIDLLVFLLGLLFYNKRVFFIFLNLIKQKETTF